MGKKKKINQENDLLPNKKQKQKIRKKKKCFLPAPYEL